MLLASLRCYTSIYDGFIWILPSDTVFVNSIKISANNETAMLSRSKACGPSGVTCFQPFDVTIMLKCHAIFCSNWISPILWVPKSFVGSGWKRETMHWTLEPVWRRLKCKSKAIVHCVMVHRLPNDHFYQKLKLPLSLRNTPPPSFLNTIQLIHLLGSIFRYLDDLPTNVMDYLMGWSSEKYIM